MSKIKNVFLTMIICTSVNCFGQKNNPTGLLCELLAHPELSVITSRTPEFGWIVNSALPGDYQTAYQILVASSPFLLTSDNPELWDSGKVLSNQSINIPYGGKPLSPNQSYWWKVQTWGKTDIGSGWSEPQKFNTSEFDAQKQWPGESKWVKISNGKGGQLWTMENRHPIKYHDVVPDRIITRNNGMLFYDFKRSAFSYLTFNITSKSPLREAFVLKIRVGEKAVGDSIDQKPGGGIIYQAYDLPIREGTHDYELKIPRFVAEYPHSQNLPAELPEVIPFRYCEILLPKGVIKVNNIIQKGLYYLYDSEASSFSCSNEKLNAIYDLCKYSTIANTYNGDYANSQRERMMYEADCYIQQMCHYSIDREYAIGRYSTENLIYHATWPTEWICHSVFMAWADYLNTGNTRLIREYYNDLKAKTLIALETENGLISTLTGLQTKEFLQSIHFNGKKLVDIVDWPSEMQGIQPSGERDNHELKTYNSVVNAFYYRSLVLMGKMAKAVNNLADADLFEQKAQKVKTIFNTQFFDPKKGSYIDGIGSQHSSIQSNLFPLAFGLVPADKEKGVVKYIKSKGMACGVYAANFLMEGLYNANEGQYGLDLLTSETDRSWMNMIRTGSTMTTEAWDVKYMPDLMGWSHAWSASPAHIIPRKLMGIEPAEPGFGKISFKPQPGNLTQATLKLPTIRGVVLCSFKQEAGVSFELNITIPANTTAKVSLPEMGEKNSLTMDGQPVLAPSVELSRIIIEDVSSGSHLFRVQKVN
jgi:hypothetical protein